MLADKLNLVKKNIENACETAGRSPQEVTLIAVSKTKPVEMLKEAYDAGARVFGENKVQEIMDKYDQMPSDVQWHMIGHLQRNKVKYIIDKVSMIHSVDSVRLDATAKSVAEQEGVDLRLYRVIYQAIEDVEAAMKGMLDPVFEEKVLGHAEVRQIFKASGVGNIAGSYVLDGVFQRNCQVRITRDGEQIFEGALASLKRFKDDVKEVKAGYECGLVFEDFNDIKEEDRVEAYTMVEVPR